MRDERSSQGSKSNQDLQCNNVRVLGAFEENPWCLKGSPRLIIQIRYNAALVLIPYSDWKLFPAENWTSTTSSSTTTKHHALNSIITRPGLHATQIFAALSWKWVHTLIWAKSRLINTWKAIKKNLYTNTLHLVKLQSANNLLQLCRFCWFFHGSEPPTTEE